MGISSWSDGWLARNVKSLEQSGEDRDRLMTLKFEMRCRAANRVV